MEKRFISFLLIAFAVMVGYTFLMQAMFGPPPVPRAKQEVAQANEPGEGALAAEEDAPDAIAGGDSDSEPPSESNQNESEVDVAVDEDRDEEVAAEIQPESEQPIQFSSLGSLDPDSDFQMLVVFNNQGGSIHSVELADPKYGELNRKFGYIGSLALIPNDGQGCRVQVVGDGTPAALAGIRGPEFKTVDGETTIQRAGDVITQLGDREVNSISDFNSAIQRTKPGVETTIKVLRANGVEETLSIVPTRAPLTLLRTQPFKVDKEDRAHPSFLLTLNQIGTAKARFKEDEIKGLPSLHHQNWQVELVRGRAGEGDAVEYRARLSQAALGQLKLEGDFEIVKRYRLAKSERNENGLKNYDGYRLAFDIEIRNVSDKNQKIAYQIDGPTGMTTEGWWYSYKTHPKRFVSAGARDIAWCEERGAHQLKTCSEITKSAEEDEDKDSVPLSKSDGDIRMRYAGCDTQYFAAVLMPRQNAESAEPVVTDEFDTASAFAVGPLDKEQLKRTDVTFRLNSQLFDIAAGESIERSYDLFFGPKDKNVLKLYQLEDFIVYGWFGWVSKPMLMLLHGFYWLTGKFSYGLAIILLTVLVRGCMYPFGRKMARNAQKMQELAPEMKKIADKYKNDMEKRAEAQRELFAKHKYNPLSGCMVMFIQMPVFLGLYRGLSCDIELRQAPLIPGISWCSNLAGPDMFWNWQGIAPEMLTSTKGLFGLGPYMNILPLFTVVLFIAQQKLFTPPPQDEQQAMQHTIMKFMMVFMGFVFHKVAAGLCLYIIASTLWGLGERLLLPKSTPINKSNPQPVAVGAGAGKNGASGSGSRKKKNKRR